MQTVRGFWGPVFMAVLLTNLHCADESVKASGFEPNFASTAIGERPAVAQHLEQSAVDSGAVSFQQIFAHGKLIFSARFNRLDGEGRPASTGGGAVRSPDQPAFIRTSGPDANSCTGCHNQPEPGGAGDFVANVFVLAQTMDPVTFSVGPEAGNERNTLGMHGSGAIEMLAREMTADLIAIREAARQRCQARVAAGEAAMAVLERSPLVTKGVSFGSITMRGDGKLDPSAIEGVDWDLIVKPFHQKGAVVSLREFTNNAMNHHHGIQTVERFGSGLDPDQDGVVNELLGGDVTATAVFQAALNIPGRLVRKLPAARLAANHGEVLFADLGCTGCHLPALTLNSRVFSEPNPYNPKGNLSVGDVVRPFTFDLAVQGEAPRLEPNASGGAEVHAYTDLKRHDLVDGNYRHFDNELLAQGNLYGFADPSDFYNAPTSAARPTREFLTRKLWDVGNTMPYGHRGDLSTITDAISQHGGAARLSRDRFFDLPTSDQATVVEFLKQLQILPPGSASVVEGPD